MSSRESIIAAARELFTTRGYEATSPRDIMDRARAGQGSFYHHFRSKGQLARDVLSRVSDDLLGIGRSQLEGEGPALGRVGAYLRADREALRGCRLGRFAYDQGLEEAGLREPTARYFKEMEELLKGAFGELAGGAGRSGGGDPAKLAACALATVQGGYVLARIHGDPGHLNRAVEGLWWLLECTFGGEPEARR